MGENDQPTGGNPGAAEDLEKASLDTVYEKLPTSAKGLASAEAKQRLEKYGRNELVEKEASDPATPTDYGKLSTLISMDFFGNSTDAGPDPRLRQAWGQLDDFFWGGALRAGQSWTSWDDVPALPETMDFEGPNGSQQTRQTLVRWSREFQKNMNSGSL